MSNPFASATPGSVLAKLQRVEQLMANLNQIRNALEGMLRRLTSTDTHPAAGVPDLEIWLQQQIKQCIFFNALLEVLCNDIRASEVD